jgi:protein gp37
MNATPIQWTDVTWNPIRGCTRISEGCRFCYAERDAARKNENPKIPGYHGFSRFVQIGGKPVPRWTGVVSTVPHKMTEPLHWSKPKRIFVNSMSDMFHEGVSDDDLLGLFAVMANSHIATGVKKTHTFQILTKRYERMLDFVARLKWRFGAFGLCQEIKPDGSIGNILLNNLPFLAGNDPWRTLSKGGVGSTVRTSQEWMPPQIHLGVSVEDEQNAEKRIPALLKTPASIRFVSYEPALGPVDFRPWLGVGPARDRGLDWIIAGGESGPNARPPNPDWFRAVRDACRVFGADNGPVRFFFKQWGDWSPDKPDNWVKKSSKRYSHETFAWARDGSPYNALNPPANHFPTTMMYRVGKAKAGRLLDGREWNQMP